MFKIRSFFRARLFTRLCVSFDILFTYVRYLHHFNKSGGFESIQLV